MTKYVKFQVFMSYQLDDKFIDQNRKNHEWDIFNFSIISQILVELLRHTIPHFKALYQLF